MPDRYDPRLSLRPGGDRKPADVRRGPANDPLAELAKIVAGRPTTPATQRPRANGAPDPATSPGGGDVLGDLETELLNDLQASFATVREMVPPPPSQPAPAARQAPPQMAPEPAPPPQYQQRRPEPQQRMPEPQERAPEPPPMRADRYYTQPLPMPEDREPEELAEMFAPLPPDPEPEPAPLPPRMSDRAAGRQTPPRLVPVSPVQREADLPPPAPERPARATRLPSAEKPDLGAFQMRATNPPAAPPPASSPGRTSQHSRWEKPDAAKSSAGSRFAPPRQPVVPPKAASRPADDDDLDAFGDEELFAAPGDAIGRAEEFPLEGFGDTETFDDEAPHYQDDLASMMEPRRPRGLIIAGAVVAVVLAGGIAVAMFRPGGSGTETPPIIVADGEPTKITPDATAAADDPSNKLIYDRVDSGEETAAGTALESGTEPLAALPTDDAGDNPITRVIIPGGPGIDAPADEGLSLDGQPSTIPDELAAMQAANEPEPAIDTSGPRRVRTVIVKPDGTIVESAAAEEAAVEPPPALVAAAPAAAPAEPPPITDDTAAISGNGELAITADPGLASTAADVGSIPPPAEPEPLPLAPAAPAPAVVAAAEPTQPLDLSQPEPAVAAAPGAASGMLVQVSSQRSEDAARATYRDLQERYPGILGGFEPNIQRADIPDRGTFFRVRVGPFSAGDAQRLCDDLKSAGGDCILAQR